MELETFFYTKENAWSLPALPDLDSERTAIFVFAAPEYLEDLEPIEALSNSFPSSNIIGCSSAGEILHTAVSDGSIVIAALRFERTDLKTTCATVHTSKESFDAGQSIAQELMSNDLKGVFILSPGTDVNGSELIKGIFSIIPTSIPITGGLAGDGGRFERTWTLLGGDLHTEKVVALGFYGEHIQIGYGSGGGWDIFGPERRITESSGNILYALDNKPALTLYKRYLGDRASGLPATALLFPLAIRNEASQGREVVRTILSVDEEMQSMTFAGDIPKGCMAQLMKANVDRLIDGALAAAEKAKQVNPNGNNMLSIAVSCVGRRFVMSGRTDEELEVTYECMPPGTQQIGFYSYGEIAPVDEKASDLHNQTMTLTTIVEV
jgi:hypothetical protein